MRIHYQKTTSIVYRKKGIRKGCYCASTKRTQTGFGLSIELPVGVRSPVFASTRKTTTLLVFWLAASRKAPEGSIQKLRGSLSTRWFVLDESELAEFFVDGEHGNAVVTSIGAVNEFAVGMDTNFGSTVVTRKILW